MGDENGNGAWSKYQKLILQEIKDLKLEAEVTNKRLRCIEIDMAMLKVRAGIWGGVSWSDSSHGLVSFKKYIRREKKWI